MKDSSQWLDDPDYYRVVGETVLNRKVCDPDQMFLDWVSFVEGQVDLAKFHEHAPKAFGAIFCSAFFDRWQLRYWRMVLRDRPKALQEKLTPMMNAALGRWWHLNAMGILDVGMVSHSDTEFSLFGSSWEKSNYQIPDRVKRLLGWWNRYQSVKETAQKQEEGSKAMIQSIEIRHTDSKRESHADAEKQESDHRRSIALFRAEREPVLSHLKDREAQLVAQIQRERSLGLSASADTQELQAMIDGLHPKPKATK